MRRRTVRLSVIVSGQGGSLTGSRRLCVAHYCFDETIGILDATVSVRGSWQVKSVWCASERQLLSHCFVVLVSIIRNNYMHWSIERLEYY